MRWPAKRIASQNDKGFGMYELAAGLQADGADVIHLEVGRPSLDTPQHIKDAAKKALDDGIVHYGDLQGTGSLRTALSEKVRSFNKLPLDPDEILITNGLTQAAFATFAASIDQNDEVIVFEPFYPQHNPKVALLGGKIVRVPLAKSREGFRLDAGALEAAITPKTKMVVLINPANPVGTVYSREELEALAEVVIRHDLLVLSDEVYEYVVYSPNRHTSIASLPGMLERTISTFAFTKAFCMDGWRLGYVAAQRHFVQDIMKVTLNETTHPCVFAQEGAVAAVTGPQTCLTDLLAQDEQRRDMIHQRLNAMPGVHCHLPQGAIYAFPDVSSFGQPTQVLAEEILQKAHVATEAGSFYGATGEGHLRLCFASEPLDRLDEAMNRLESYFAALQKDVA